MLKNIILIKAGKSWEETSNNTLPINQVVECANQLKNKGYEIYWVESADTKCYKELMQHDHLVPEESLVIGPNSESIETALSLRMQGIIFKNKNQLSKRLEECIIKNLPWKVKETSQQTIGRFRVNYDILSFKDNKEQPYSYVKVKSGVCILPIVEDEIIIIKQYRYSTERWSWELPAGMIDDGEESIDAAKRELTEETGYVADEIGYLGSVYPSEGYTNEVIYLYYAKCNNQIEQHLEATEQIKVYKKSFDAIRQMILNNEFKHGGGIAAIFKYMLLNK